MYKYKFVPGGSICVKCQMCGRVVGPLTQKIIKAVKTEFPGEMNEEEWKKCMVRIDELRAPLRGCADCYQTPFVSFGVARFS